MPTDVVDAVAKMAATTVRGALRLSNGDAKVNPEIESERRKAEFNPEDVTYFLEGGQENTERRRALGNSVYICIGQGCHLVNTAGILGPTLTYLVMFARFSRKL